MSKAQRRAQEEDAAQMRAALDEARKGTPSPNPHVGAIVVASDGRVVGRGHHPRRGQEHAEVAALREAGAASRGGTIYVTLEPCNHHGRTPPCTEAILAAGIARVVVGMRDPNPHVQGGGDDRLRAAGCEVVEAVEEAACVRFLAPWSKHVRSGLPWVRLKLAASLDGRIAAAPHASRPDAPRGVSRWITGPLARASVHAMRAAADAVAVGIGTALADDPELTPRDAAKIDGRDAPVRVVLDASARLPLESKLVRGARVPGAPPLWVVVADDAAADARKRLEDAGVRTLTVPRAAPGKGEGLELSATLAALGHEGIVDLLVEGGARLGGALVGGDHVDELAWFVAPIALGEHGAAALAGLAPITPEGAPRYRLEGVEPIGDDVLLRLLRR
jgi:diaminohydroxyphosphoribosylaminopyrimidine deaminase/5-amino-6-(5-phosphoribosylamino)uracil reductase